MTLTKWSSTLGDSELPSKCLHMWNYSDHKHRGSYFKGAREQYRWGNFVWRILYGEEGFLHNAFSVVSGGIPKTTVDFWSVPFVGTEKKMKMENHYLIRGGITEWSECRCGGFLVCAESRNISSAWFDSFNCSTQSFHQLQSATANQVPERCTNRREPLFTLLTL